MANSNRVFVSPGVYTSELDLTFVAQSVGVTTLGLVGETLKGPAFEPILISSWDEFRSYFGTSSPELDGVGNPKYELPYFAKSYLSEANQLFVTRILGYTGYKPGYSYGIKTLGGVNLGSYSGLTSGLTMSGGSTTITGSTIYGELSGKTNISNNLSVTNYIVTNYGGFSSSDNGKWFAIGLIPSANIPAGTEVKSPFTDDYNANNKNKKEWYNQFFNKTGATDSTIDGVYSYLFVYASGTSKFDVTRFKYSASLNTDYDNVVVACLRSRGHYQQNILNLEVTGTTSVALSSTNDTTVDPYKDFTINVTGKTGGAKSFTCNMDSISSKSLTKVLGSEVFDRSYSDNPLYVHEFYPNLLKNAYQQGYVRGISLTIVTNDESTSFLPTNGGYKAFDTPMSPMVVSEVRGGKVLDLFNVFTISDGDDANYEVKVSIQNINIDNGEFDVIVRNFYDTDSNQVILEKFSRCSMNPDASGYVAIKIGTVDGQYQLKSKYIMISMDPNAPVDAIPAGFRGFVKNTIFGSSKLGEAMYKTKYFDAGDTIYYGADGTANISSGDKIRNVTLGISSSDGFTYDADLFKYKGSRAGGQTFGFHLSANASSLSAISGTTGTTGTTYSTTPYDLEGQTTGTTGTNKLTTSANRKFTFAVCGGFDGWDIYRNTRTYSNDYILGKKTYTDSNLDNGGVFNKTIGNSDYYAYNDGIQTFANPESVDINVFATPGINFYDHSSLTNQAIEMIEVDRADALYIISSPNEMTADGVVGDIVDQEYDSNYSATYWPWIQIKDVDNATQLYIPPTGEVLKNIALTDNIAYPWYASAGYSRGLVNSIKAVKKLTADERDLLYKNRINPIATFSDTGTIIWGNKTLQVRESALDRINVRRLLLRARKLISAVCVRLLFEQNDEQIRQEFLRLVNPILEAIKKERGLTDFRVTVSNDPADIDANTLRGKIFIKPTRSLEFIDVEFIITPTGASFENI